MVRGVSDGLFLLPLFHMLMVFMVKVDAGGLTKLRRQKREWIIPPKKLTENVDYRNYRYIAKIRSDEESRTSIIYSLKGHGADKEPIGLFIVDRTSGNVRITGILDREETASYHLQGVAKFTNGSLAEKNIDLRITVEDENDNDPIFTIMQPGAVSELSQTASYIMKIMATDADDPQTPNAQIAYRIDKQIPEGEMMFYINAETGEIYVQQGTLDREMHSSYTLTVTASDLNGAARCRTGKGSLVINILDVNDNVPTLEKTNYEGSIEENTVNVEVMRIQALDLDMINTDNWRAIFSIVVGNEAGYFSITTDEKTNEGIIMLVKTIDYEEMKEINIRVAVANKAAYHSSVSVEQGSTSYPIKIKVKNQPEGPKFIPKMKSISISENSKIVSVHSVIATYAAIDGDTQLAAENVRYAKGHDPANWLVIDEKTAEIKLSQIPDRESKFLTNGTYIAKIICITNDLPMKTATGTIFIQVEDFNDHCPILTAMAHTVCAHDGVVPITAVDADAEPNGAPFEFIVVPTGTKQEWKVEHINDTSAILRAQGQLWPGSYRVVVDVRDQQGKVCDEHQVLDLMVCTCEDDKVCGGRAIPSAVFGAPGVGLMLLALLLLLLVPLLLLFCSCSGKDFLMIPFDAKEHLMEYRTERPGEDKEVPLLKCPMEGVAPIKMNIIEGYGEGKGFGGATGVGFGDAVGVSFAGAVGASFGGAGGGTEAGVSSSSVWGYGEGMQTSETKASYSRIEDMRQGAWDGIALTEAFLGDYYSQKLSCAESNDVQKDGLLIYEYEGQESPVGSVGCCSFIDTDDDLGFLNDLDPKFKTLAEICRDSAIESDVLSTAPVGPSNFSYPVPLPDVHVGVTSSTTATRTEITEETLLTAHALGTAGPVPSTCVGECLLTEASYSATAVSSLPSVHVTENVVVLDPVYAIQPQPLYYTAAPVLQTTCYVLGSPSRSPNLLVVERQLTQESLSGLKQGLLQETSPSRSPNLLVVESQLTQESLSGLKQGLLQETTPSRSPNVLVVESQLTQESLSGPNEVVRQEMGPLASQDLLLVESQVSQQSLSEPKEVVPQEMGPSASQDMLLVESQVTQERLSGPNENVLQGTSTSGSQDLLLVESNKQLGLSTESVEEEMFASQSSQSIQEQSASSALGSQEGAELQAVPPPGAHMAFMQEQLVSISEKSVQQITTSAHHIPI